MKVEITSLWTVVGAVGSTALTLWAHTREIKKQQRKTLEAYAQNQVEANGRVRDINHLKARINDLSANVAKELKEIDRKFEEDGDRDRENDVRVAKIEGALQMLINRSRASD